MRTAPAFAALVLLASRMASAGDYADRDILGFSPDGAYFAFEQYGVGDGSGWAYADVFIIDTAADEWVAGTPVRVFPKDENVTLAAVRAELRAKAQPFLKKYGIEVPGQVVASNPATEISADPDSVRFRTNPYLGSDDRILTLTLTEIPFDDPPGCENLGPVAGFRLTLANIRATRILHEDRKLPASRGCALEYAISDVVALEDGGPGEAVLVVLIGIYTQGFEGADRRFMAVTARVPLSLY